MEFLFFTRKLTSSITLYYFLNTYTDNFRCEKNIFIFGKY